MAPIAYWHMFLKPKLEKLLLKKLAQNRPVQCDETNVVVSVKGRSERDLTKRFDNLDVDWSIIEKQLIGWGELFRSSKKLRVDLSFNFVDSRPSTGPRNKGLNEALLPYSECFLTVPHSLMQSKIPVRIPRFGE